MPTREHVYRVTEVVRVVDGDTYWFRVDTGFRGVTLVNVRLLGYDTPEANVKDARERAAATSARHVAERWLREMVDAPHDGVLWVRTEKDPDSFGRWLGEVWVEYPGGEAQRLGDVLSVKSLASAWPTRWRDAGLTPSE